MTTQVFPYLAGVAFPTGRAPVWDTSKQVSVSGKETRFANRTQARYKYSLTCAALDASGAYPGAAVQSKQALEALFNNTLGGALIFNYFDPTDNYAAAQPFGVGDGTTTAFQLYRTTAAGWNDAVFAPLIASAPTLVASSAGLVYASNNLLLYSGDTTNAAWIDSNVTVTGGVADPLGGTAAQTATATAANGLFYQHPAASGSNYVSSAWVRRRTGSGAIYLRTPTDSNVPIAVGSAWQRFSTSGAPNAGGAFWTLQFATSGDAVDVYAPQVEQSTLTTAGTYVLTGAAANMGVPSIFVNGALQATSAYSVSSAGIVTFTAAPAAAAALTWSGTYYWPCSFDEDTLALSQIMGGLWECRKIAFTTRVF